MQNIKVSVKKDGKGVPTTAIFEVDLSQRLGLSASKKTMLIASTQGNRPLDGVPGVSFGLTVYTKEGVEKAIKDGAKTAE